jgi:hypothetical protein
VAVNSSPSASKTVNGVKPSPRRNNTLPHGTMLLVSGATVPAL